MIILCNTKNNLPWSFQLQRRILFYFDSPFLKLKFINLKLQQKFKIVKTKIITNT